MDMTGERRIPAPRQKVWDALNDPVILKACIPGCETLEKTGDTDLKATASVKIGPIAARFSGKVQLVDLNPPNSYRIQGEGAGGVAGFAKGGANVQLVDEGNNTLLTYDVKAQVGGKIAQLGARLIDATSKQMADMFFDRFTAVVSEPNPDAAAVASEQPHLANIDPAVSATPLPIQPGLMPVEPAKVGIPIWALIPKTVFGLPIVAVIGIVIYLPIIYLLISAYL